MRKSVVRVSDQVLHKPGSKTTGDGYRLGILDLRRRGIYYRCRENKGADRGSREADLCLCFCIMSDEPCYEDHNKGTNQHAHSCIRLSTFLVRKRL